MFPSLSSVVSEFCIVLPENPTGEEGRILNFSVSKPLAYMNPEALRYIAKMKRERDLLALFQQELHLFLSEKKRISCQMNDSYVITNGIQPFLQQSHRDIQRVCFPFPTLHMMLLHPQICPIRSESCSSGTPCDSSLSGKLTQPFKNLLFFSLVCSYLFYTYRSSLRNCVLQA